MVCVLALTVAGCRSIEEGSAPDYEPAVAEALEGSHLTQVTFTREAAERVALQTAVVERSGRRTTVPYAALVYDPSGQVWVYTSPEPLTYVRAPVVIASISGDLAILQSSPPVGTRVVTVGATEVYGVELGIAGGH